MWLNACQCKHTRCSVLAAATTTMPAQGNRTQTMARRLNPVIGCAGLRPAEKLALCCARLDS